VEPDEIVRGYEYDKGQFVTVSDWEIEAAAPKKSREIDLRLFVPIDQIPAVYFDRPYFLAPTGDSTKAYRLLCQTMERSRRAGIATFVMRDREYLVAILAGDGLLKAITMRFADEIRDSGEAGLSGQKDASPKEVEELEESIMAASGEAPDDRELEDPLRKKLLDMVEQRRREGKEVSYAREPAPVEEPEGAEIIDLMAILKKSLKEKDSSEKGKKESGTRTRQKSEKAPEEGLSNKNRDDLYGLARKKDIPGRSQMSKKELVEALEKSS
jgi:DNA end-binding protein Ku